MDLYDAHEKRHLTTVESVVARLQDLIRERNLQVGQRLPAERELVTLLGVSRTSLREALKLLTSLRIVRSRRGSGVYLQTSLSEVSLESLLLQQQLGIDISQHELRDILEVRRGLELFCVRLACQRLQADAVPVLEDVLRRAEQKIEAGEPIEQEDRDFHLALAGAGGNRMLPRLMNTFYLLSLNRRQRYFADPRRCRRSHEQHVGLLEAVVAQDEELAVARMTIHLREAEDAWNVRLDANVSAS